MEELDRMRGAYRQKRKTVPQSLQPKPAAKEEQWTLERLPWRVPNIASQGLKGLTIPQRVGTLRALQAPSPARVRVAPPLVPRPPSSRHLKDIARHFADDRGAEGLALEGLRYAHDRNLISPHEQTASHVTEPSRAEFSQAEKGFGRKDNRETAQKTSGKRVRGQYTKSRYDGRQDQATLGTAQEEEKGSDWGLSSIWGGGKKKKKSSKSVKLDSPRRGTTFNPSVKRPREYSDSVPKSPGATILQRGRLKRDYAAFDTNEGPQQGGGVQSDMRYNHRPESNQPGEMFMSPEMQNSLLPSVSTEEKQAQQAHQQTQNQGQTRRSPALVHLARPHSQAYDAQDQASQRAINIASGAGQESTGSHITSSDTAPIFKFDPILAPPEMPPRLYPQNMYIPGGEPMMRPPSSRAYPPTPEEAMRKFKRQQTTPAFVSPESARIQPIDELHDRSPGIMDERTACSGYRSFRGGLKYTISEDRTTDAFKRRKVHFIALGHSNSRAAEVEEVDKSDAARASVLADSNPSDDTGTMYTDNLEDLFNMDEYENPEQSTFDDAFFNFE